MTWIKKSVFIDSEVFLSVKKIGTFILVMTQKQVNFHGLTPVALAEDELHSPAFSGYPSSHALTRGALRR